MKLKTGDWVVCQSGVGNKIGPSGKEIIRTHFPDNSICKIKSIEGDKAHVFVINAKADFVVDTWSLQYVDVTKTGKEFDKKICNVCHVLKGHAEFSINQTDARGGKTSRPSCKACRKVMEGNKVPQHLIRRMRETKPEKGDLFECPICRKISIAFVTANIVLDHDHVQGVPRTWICDSCNTGLGRFKNGENLLRNALTYIQSFV